MLPMVSAAPDEAVLRALENTAGEIAQTEERLRILRGARDEGIRSAVVDHGVSERAAAEKAGVSPSYAHTAAKHGRYSTVALSEAHRRRPRR